jgi:alkylation response protein AidB-like acyl-CoA dehydrogenase
MKLSRQGTPEQTARYLPGMAAGRVIGCGAVTEPGAGSNVRQIRTRAVRDGTGWRLSGEKTFISNATVFDIATVLARTADREFTLFILDRAEHRFETREIGKLGLNGWSFGSISFDDLRIDDAFRLGDPGSGHREALSGFERARAWVAVIASGIARAALDDAIGYAVERDQFGVPVATHQLVQGLLADMACEAEAASLMTLKALASLDRGGRADLPTSMAKIYASEAAVRVASKAIQVHGAAGVTREFPVERHLRNARMLTIPDGTTQINQLIVGRELTGIAAFLGAARPQATRTAAE